MIIRGKRGFSLIELLMVLVIIVMILVVFLTVCEVRYRTIVKTEVIMFISNFDTCRKLAAMSSKGKAALIFRPTDAPYTYYYISTDFQQAKYFYLSKGVTIHNTNGIIENHIMRVALNGSILDEFGNPRDYPNPGIITFRSVETDKVYRVIIDPQTGTIWYE